MRSLPHLTLRFLLAGSFVLACGSCSAQAQEPGRGSGAKTKTDAQVIEELAASNRQKADAAVDEIMSRGVRMISLLMKKEGDHRFFRGFLARNPLTATGVTAASGDPKKDRILLEEGRLVTVEVAALYLITAIYWESLHIAQSPYLTDYSLPVEKRKSRNTKSVVEKAWKATSEWYGRLTTSDITKLRAADHYPLRFSDVGFH